MRVVPMPKADPTFDEIMEEAVRSTALAVVPEPRTLADVASDIRTSHAETMEGLSATAARAIAVGDFLNEARGLVPHGEWEDFVTLECGLKLSTAANYQKLSSRKDELAQLLASNPIS